jgi:hypothetical protein
MQAMTDAHDERGAHSPKYLHRQEVADRLGRTPSGVRYLEKTGRLHPERRVMKIRGVRGICWAFNETEVEALAREFSVARESAVPELRDQKVIAAYRDGKNVNDVVLELGVPHDVAETIWKRFKRYEPKDPDAEPTSDEVLEANERAQRAHESFLAKGEDEIRALRVARQRTRRKGVA